MLSNTQILCVRHNVQMYSINNAMVFKEAMIYWAITQEIWQFQNCTRMYNIAQNVSYYGMKCVLGVQLESTPRFEKLGRLNTKMVIISIIKIITLSLHGNTAFILWRGPVISISRRERKLQRMLLPFVLLSKWLIELVATELICIIFTLRTRIF